jgi:hypothetical protein
MSPGKAVAAASGGTTMTGPSQEGVPELVVAPARPGPRADGADIVFEMRQQPDGGFVLPVFSSVRRLVEELGRSQPWACVPLRDVLATTAQGAAVRIVLDPRIDPGAWRWPSANGDTGESAGPARHTDTEGP